MWNLLYAKCDLLLLARTGFDKSLIFQLIPFWYRSTGVVIVLMPFKLLQAEQNSMTNRVASGKAIARSEKNNQKATQQAIAKKTLHAER